MTPHNLLGEILFAFVKLGEKGSNLRRLVQSQEASPFKVLF
jgi:hypothetical protein